MSKSLKNVLVTGANGFVGNVTCQALMDAEMNVRAAVRAPQSLTSNLKANDVCVVGNIDAKTDWNAALDGIDAIVHLAARVHVMKDATEDPLSAYREINVAGTRKLAESAVKQGIRRFVYISSIKVNGESTSKNQAFTEMDQANPQDPYGQSKYEAEQSLHNIAKETGLEVTILRPPLVYGPGVGANFLKLMKLVTKRIPLPLGAVNNLRSMIYVENLADAIVCTLQHPKAVGQTYLLADPETLSTKELICRLADALGCKAVMVPFPKTLLQLLAKVVGKSAMVDRLVESLRVDNSKIVSELDWQPPYSIESALEKTANWYRKVYG